jgi:hypothetical protein
LDDDEIRLKRRSEMIVQLPSVDGIEIQKQTDWIEEGKPHVVYRGRKDDRECVSMISVGLTEYNPSMAENLAIEDIVRFFNGPG